MENQPGSYPPQTDLQQKNLPNATAVLILGIVSIVGCAGYGIAGLTCGIIALVLNSKDMARYRAEPQAWSPQSVSNLKAGKVCAIVGTSLSGAFLLYIMCVMLIWGMAIGTLLAL